MCFWRKCLIAGSVAMGSSAFAADLSLVSGLYKNSKTTVSGNDAGATSTIELGGRYGDLIDSHWGWFGQALMALRSYDAPNGVNEPGDSTSLSLGGGVRYIGKRWSEFAIPYLWALGSYRNEKTAEPTGTFFSEREVNGLFYSAGFTLRLTVTPLIFIELENAIFESALFASVKTQTQVAAGSDAATREESKNELYFKTFAPLTNCTVNIGIKF